MDRRLEETRDLALKELEGITSKGSLNQERLCNIDKLVDIIKDIDEMGMSGDNYSQGRYSMRRGYSRGYDDGSYNGSYGDGSYNDGSHVSYRGYSRDDGKESMISHLEELMRNAKNEQDRESIRRTIIQMER